MDYPIKNSESPTKATRAGFTLPELMVSLIIFALVAHGIYTTYFAFSKASKVAIEHVQSSHASQFALKKMHKAIRSAQEVHDTSSNKFEFTYIDLNGDAVRLRFYLADVTGILFEHNVTENTTRALLDNVESLTFSYFDRFGASTTTQIDINAVKLSIETQTPVIRGSQDRALELAMITFRNRLL